MCRGQAWARRDRDIPQNFGQALDRMGFWKPLVVHPSRSKIFGTPSPQESNLAHVCGGRPKNRGEGVAPRAPLKSDNVLNLSMHRNQSFKISQ